MKLMLHNRTNKLCNAVADSFLILIDKSREYSLFDPKRLPMNDNKSCTSNKVKHGTLTNFSPLQKACSSVLTLTTFSVAALLHIVEFEHCLMTQRHYTAQG